MPGISQLTRIGSGGFATVFRGRQDRFDRVVAVKVLHTDDLDEASRRRFERECAVMGRLSSHRHVVNIHDSGYLTDGRPYLIMEFCPGGSFKSGPPDTVQSVESTGQQIASALAYAHSAGVVHRDVKPANILLRADREAALADFGLSLRRDVDVSAGLDAISLGYTAPEVLAEGRIGAAADVYALGASLFNVLTGSPPVERQQDETPARYLLRSLEAPAPQMPSHVGPALASILSGMLERDPQDRPTAQECADGLAQIGSRSMPLRGVQPEQPRGDTGGPQDSDSATILRPASDAAPPAPQPVRRQKWLPAAISVMVVLAGVGLVLTANLVKPTSGVTTRKTPAPSPSPTPGNTPPPGLTVVLQPPEILGAKRDLVRLTWSQVPPGYYVYVVQREAKREPFQLQAGTNFQLIAVQPKRPYCYVVEITNFHWVVKSNARAINGARCKPDGTII